MKLKRNSSRQMLSFKKYYRTNLSYNVPINNVKFIVPSKSFINEN